MRKIITLIILISTISINANSTPQTPDMLIVGQDTFYLYNTFPIEDLELTINYNPFIKKGEYEIHSTACWRGYRAIWEIKNKKMYLQTIESCMFDSTYEYSVVIDFLKKNGYKPKIEDGKILADWYTSYLVKNDDPLDEFCTTCLMGKDDIKDVDNLYYTIIKGELYQFK